MKLDNFLMLCFFIVLLVIIVGLIKPNLVVKWGRKRTRTSVVLYYFPIIFIVLLIAGKNDADHGYENGVAAYSQGDYKHAIVGLSFVGKDDKNYQNAINMLASASLKQASIEAGQEKYDKAIKILSDVPKTAADYSKISDLLKSIKSQKMKSDEINAQQKLQEKQQKQADKTKKVEGKKEKLHELIAAMKDKAHSYKAELDAANNESIKHQPTAVDISKAKPLDYRKAMFGDYPKGTPVIIHGQIFQVLDDDEFNIMTRSEYGIFINDPVIVDFPDKPRVLEQDLIDVIAIYDGTVDMEGLLLKNNVKVPVFHAVQYQSYASN